MLTTKNYQFFFILICASVFFAALRIDHASAVEDSNQRMNWWDWQSDGDGLEMCPENLGLPCVVFRKITPDARCRNISGDFENIATGMEAEGNDRLTVKFFNCNRNFGELGVMCIDTAQDGGFEACGLVRKQIDAAAFAAAPRKQRKFQLNKRPKK